jgi:hypothetical protein
LQNEIFHKDHPMSEKISPILVMLNKKFPIFDITQPLIKNSESYLIFNNGVSENIILEELMRFGKKNFCGFVKTINKDEPSLNVHSDAPIYLLEQALDALQNGVHLIINSGSLPDLFENIDIDFLNDRQKFLHLSNISKYYETNSQENYFKLICINNRIYTSWLTNLLIKGNAKYAVKTLELFLTLQNLPEMSLERRRSILAQERYTDLPSGVISRIYFGAGNLEMGWLYYQDAVREPSQKMNVNIPHRYWAGESFAGKKVVFQREPGPADEILYSSVFNDVIETGGQPIIVVDRRLHTIFQRSFPEATVLPRDNKKISPQLLEQDIKFKASYSDPYGEYRIKKKQFKGYKGHLIADQNQVHNWKIELNKLFPTGLNVGISWCSSSTGVLEDQMDTNLNDWIPLLSTLNVNFISLQYGDKRKDITRINKGSNATIHLLPEVDLFNDFDALAAIIKNLSLVISVNNINSHITGAIGTPLWQICPTYWFQFFGQDYDLFYPQARNFGTTRNDLSELNVEFSRLMLKFKRTNKSEESFRKLFQRKTD